MTVEAKADEPYGATVAKTICAALERRIDNPRSRGVERISDLATSLLTPWSKGLPHIDGLFYQLLTATAGTLAYAIQNKASPAVLIVHEFVTDKTDDAKHASNAKAYRDFIRRLYGDALLDKELRGLIGPFTVPGLPLFEFPPPLLVGKLVTDQRSG